MDDNKFQLEVLQRLTAIETTLKSLDYKAIIETLGQLERRTVKLEEQTKEHETKINKIEDNGRWLWRTVAGSIILAILGIIFKL